MREYRIVHDIPQFVSSKSRTIARMNVYIAAVIVMRRDIVPLKYFTPLFLISDRFGEFGFYYYSINIPMYVKM